MPAPSQIHWPLAAAKVIVFLVALGLNVSGKLSPESAGVIMTLIAALGGVHAAWLLQKPTGAAADVVDKAGSLLVSLLGAIDRTRGAADFLAAKAAPTTPAQAPPPDPKPAPAAAAAIIASKAGLVLLLVLLPKLLGGCAPVTPKTATGVVVGIDAAACVLRTAAKDVAAGLQAPDTAIDIAKSCGLQLSQVATLLDAQAGAADAGLSPEKARSVVLAARALPQS